MILNRSGWPEISGETTVSITLEFVASMSLHLLHLVTLLLPAAQKTVLNDLLHNEQVRSKSSGSYKDRGLPAIIVSH